MALPSKQRIKNTRKTDPLVSLEELILRLTYVANMIVAGLFGGVSLTSARMASSFTFGGTWKPHPALKRMGCIWIAIAQCSVLALFAPYAFIPVLLAQLIYKTLWLGAYALPLLGSDLCVPIPWSAFITQFTGTGS